MERETMAKYMKSTSSQDMQDELTNIQPQLRMTDLIKLWQRKSTTSDLDKEQKRDKKRPVATDYYPLTEEMKDVKQQLTITCQTVNDRKSVVEDLRKKNACINEEQKESLTDSKTVTKEKNRWKQKEVELYENLEDFQKSRLNFKTELFERNPAVAALKESIKEADVHIAKSKDIEIEAMISSWNETAQNRKREVEKRYQKLQEKSPDSNLLTKGNHEEIQRLFDFNSTLIRSLNDIQNDIQKEIKNAKFRKSLSIADYLGSILEENDNLEHSTIASLNSRKNKTDQDSYILEESRAESKIVFLKWLRGYLSNLWSSQEKEYMKSKGVILDLISVIMSKAETNNDLIDQIDYLLVKCEAMSKHIESLENICDNQEFYIKTQTANAEKMKQSKRTMNYDKVFDKTDSSRIENVTLKVKKRIQSLLEYNQAQNLENKFERASRELVNVKQEKREMMKKLRASRKHAEFLERENVIKDIKVVQTEDLLNDQTILDSRLKTADLVNVWNWNSTSSNLVEEQTTPETPPLPHRGVSSC